MILYIALGLAIVVAAALVYGSRNWQSATEAMRASMEAARLPTDSRVYYSDDLSDLPEPVQRYFRAVLTDGQPVIDAVSLEQAGTFNMNGQWRSFTADQRVITRRPGFDWNAQIAMMPGVAARVHDSYIEGEGILHASLFGLVTVSEMRGTPEMAQGELLRFFAEAPWYPTALLPSQGVQWEAVDDSSARATLTDDDLAVTILFTFGEDGLIESTYAEARGRAVADEIIMTPWEGHFSGYEERCGMLVPLEGEVGWVLPEGLSPYWRGHITSISYEFCE